MGTVTTAKRSAAGPGPSPAGFMPADRIAFDGITFDDVLLLPARSAVMPADADTATRLTRGIALNIPLVSAPMDTVTESALAIALAQEGGLGIIHKNLSVEAQAREVAKVKRSANGIILDPITLGPDDTVARAKDLMRAHNVSGFPVTEDGSTNLRGKGKVLGVITRRDLKFVENTGVKVRDVMTASGLITAPADTTLDTAERTLNENKVEKLILVDAAGRLAGLITMKDIDRQAQFPRACRDGRGRLRCGAAVGVFQFDRVEALLAADVDVLVIDTAHGHSENVLQTVRDVKAKFPGVQVIAGNIATPEAARDLVEAGADAVKVGIGPGSICTTRVVTGVGVPQVTAIMHVAQAIADLGSDVPVIADGGIRLSGDIPKAIAAGASAVMMGSLFAGLEESPGEVVITHGRRYKSYRGMGSEGAMSAGSADRYRQADKVAADGSVTRKFVPEGVEGLVAFRGTLAEFAYQLVGGLRSAMGYTGCRTIEELRTKARFCRVSAATVVENHPHDILITKESPNYMVGPKP
ncbi:MAG: inosine-5'-monophosphate dehydrogenase [Phycisphaerae bacterium]|nr:MAG: inosine-5'-monophosphate dehydrogenase [Phycisphaerae bacterium]